METTKLNIFISQPMTGYSFSEIEKRRLEIMYKVEEYFGTNNLEFQNSHFNTSSLFSKIRSKFLKNESLYWLAKSLLLLANSDIIVMATGWENSRGCRIEYECARLYDIMVIFEDTNYITREKRLEVDELK